MSGESRPPSFPPQPGGGPAPGGLPVGHHWPTPAQELLLRAALLRGDPALAAWRALRPTLDPTGADRASRRLYPLLAANLRRHGIRDDLTGRLDEWRHRAEAANQALFGAARGLLLALAEADIDTLVLKGGALASGVYRDAGLRPMGDLDVLVPTARVEQAIAVLTEAGWASRTPITPGVIAMLHAADGRAGDGASRIDLHWHAYWECCEPDGDVDLWTASVPLDLAGVRTRMLAPADQLLHVCVHGSRRARRPAIVWIADARWILEAGGVDWARLVAQAERRRVALRVRTMLAYLRSALDAPVPADALARLAALPVGRLERLEYALASQPPGLLGGLPAYWCNYRRLRRATGMRSPLGFPRYLQQTWRAPSLLGAALGGLARAGARLSSALGGAVASDLRRQ